MKEGRKARKRGRAGINEGGKRGRKKGKKEKE